MRLFLAIDLPASAKSKLNQQIETLKKDYPQFSWVSPENFHITLHFFGDIKKIDNIKKKISEAVFDVNNFSLYSLGADLFMNQKIVLYIYFKREKKVEAIVSRVKQLFQIKEDKKFIPHLTIARARIPSKQQYLNLRKKLHKLQTGINFPVSKIYLYQSILTASKPQYKRMATFFLFKQLRS